MPPFALEHEDQTICDAVRRWGQVQPEAPAVMGEGGYVLTYRGLVAAMDRIRDALRHAGLGKGSRIAIVHSGGAEMAALLLGVMNGATAVPLNPSFTRSEFIDGLGARRAAGLILDPDLQDAADAAAGALGIPVIDSSALPGIDPRTLDRVPPCDPLTISEEPPSVEDTAIVFGSSGTTARSKIVPYRHRHIVAHTTLDMRALELCPGDVGLAIRPLHYAGPFFDVADVLFSGGGVIVLPTLEATRFFRLLREKDVTWYVGGPTHHRAIHAHALQNPDDLQGVRLRLIRTASAPLEPEIAKGLERLFAAPVATSYSCTEAGRIALSYPGLAPRKPESVGRPIDRLGFAGAGVRIRSLDGRFLPDGEHGEVVVRGPQVIDGYENAPDLNAEAFVDDWFRTGDEGFLDADGYLMLTGRIKEMINRGGEKVSPAEVDTALMAHPGVREAATFPIPHATLGEEVAVAVVQETGARLTDEHLSRYLLGRLSGFKVPRRFFFVDAIPKTDTGKIQRYRLAEALGVAPEAGPVRGAPADRDATPLETRLQGLWAEALGLPHVGLNDNFFLLGGDSLRAIELFLRIERELGAPLPPSALFEAGTVAEMARRIEGDAPGGPLVALKPGGTRPPFFCVHAGDGHVIGFRHLARLLGDDQPFYALQPPWAYGRGPLPKTVEEIAETYVAAIRRVRPHGPYAIGGYSFGGVVAYEMACQLRRAGEPVALLALLDTRLRTGKTVPVPVQIRIHLERLAALDARGKAAYVGSRVRALSRLVRRRLHAAAVKSPLEAAREAHAAGRFLEAPLVLAVCRVIVRRYVPGAYDGPGVLFRTALPPSLHPDAQGIWARLMEGRLAVFPVAGRHTQILGEPHVRDLAPRLRRALEEATAGTAAA